MKLLETTFNEAYPSFKIAKMNDESVGVPYGEKLTLQLSDKYVEYTKNGVTKEISGPALLDTIEYVVKEGKAQKGQKVGDKASFVKASITGKVVGNNVDNIKYNQYDNATFEVSPGVVNKLLGLGKEELKNLVIELQLDKFYKEIDGKVQSIKYFKVSTVDDEGSVVEIGGSTSPSTPLTMSQTGLTPKIPKAIQDMHEEVAPVVLNDVEKHVFKTLLSNAEWTTWKEFAQKGSEEFVAGYEAAAKVSPDEDRVAMLYTEYLKRVN